MKLRIASLFTMIFASQCVFASDPAIPTAEELQGNSPTVAAAPAENTVPDKTITSDDDTPAGRSETTDTETVPIEEKSDQIEESEEPEKTWTHPPVPAAKDGMTNILVIPVHNQIGKTNKYILRRGLKEAIAKDAEVVVLDVDSPGGRADYMLEMMEMIDRYHGRTIAFVNKEAVSAAAIISASADEICFAPKSVIGAAAVISSDGKDIPHTLKTKLDSYMDARLRAITPEHPRRADVLRAMMQEDYVLEVDGHKIKDKGVLLSLTDTEAMKLYGNPPTPLLGSGVYDDVEALADAQYGHGNYTIRTYTTTWSEETAAFMEKAAPILMGLGFLALVVEFYTPGFGLPGITGIVLLAIVFLSNYISGLAGHEPLLFFIVGFILLMLELILLPGVMFLAITGLLLMVGSLIWSLADVWPKTGGGIDINPDFFFSALWQVAAAVLIAAVAFALLYKFLPRRVLAGRLVLNTTAGGTTKEITAEIASKQPPIGSTGTAVSNLRPSGTVDIDGTHYEATLTVGSAEKGQLVHVVGHKNAHLLVERS